MSDLTTNIEQTISDFADIKQAISDKGVDMSGTVSTSEYAGKIRSISVGDNIMIDISSQKIDGGNSVTFTTKKDDETVSEETIEIMDGITTIEVGSRVVNVDLIASGWSETLPYTQSVNIDGITENIAPYIDVNVDDEDLPLGLEQIENFSYITKADSSDNTITFMCYKDKPSIDLSVKVRIL